jgi:hypothetical protein
MARKKSKNPSILLTHPIRTRVTEQVYNKLQAMVGNSDCHSIGEVARRVLSKEKILCLHRDTSMDPLMEELSLLRKELNAIGVNINQITHLFHLAPEPERKMYHALKVAEQYNKVDAKVDKVLSILTQLTRKWLLK